MHLAYQTLYLILFWQTNFKLTKLLLLMILHTVAGKLEDMKIFWNKRAKIGRKYGYFPKATRPYLIILKSYLSDAKTMVTDRKKNHYRRKKNIQELFLEVMHTKLNTLKTLPKIGTCYLNINHLQQKVNTKQLTKNV